MKQQKNSWWFVWFGFFLFEVSKLKISQRINTISQKGAEIFCRKPTWIYFDFNARSEHSTRTHCSALWSEQSLCFSPSPLCLTLHKNKEHFPAAGQGWGCCWGWDEHGWTTRAGRLARRVNPLPSVFIMLLLLDTTAWKSSNETQLFVAIHHSYCWSCVMKRGSAVYCSPLFRNYP